MRHSSFSHPGPTISGYARFYHGRCASNKGQKAAPVKQFERSVLASERVVLSAPMSYAGSSSRLWRLTRMSEQPAWRVLLVALAVVLVAVAWVVVTAWYLIFGVLLLLPFRVFRRGQRRRRLDALRHRELLAASERRPQ